MAKPGRKDFEDMKAGDLVVYKLPGKSSRSYGEYIETEFLSSGDKAVIKDMLDNHGKIIKVPLKSIISVMDNFLKESKNNSKLSKDVQDILAAATTNIEGAGGGYGAPFYHLIPMKNEEGMDIIQVTWNLEVFDDDFKCDDCVELSAFIRPTGTSIDLVFTKPFSKVFTYTLRDENSKSIIQKQALKNLDNILRNIYADVYNKYVEFSIRHNKFVSDYADYVRAYQGHAPMAMCEAQEETSEQDAVANTTNTSFRLSKESKTVNGIKVYRVEAIADIPSLKIKKGTLGGFIEKESNLSKDSWVADNAVVLNQARISEGAIIAGNAIISDRVTIGRNCLIDGEAEIGGSGRLVNAKITDKAKLSGNINVAPKYAKLYISGNASLSGKIYIAEGETSISGKAVITGIDTGLYLSGATITDDVEIQASGQINENIALIGKTKLFGKINLEAIPSSSTIYTFKDIKSSGSFVFKAAALANLNKTTITPEEIGNKDLVGDISIKTPEDLLKVINEAQETSPIHEASNLKKFVIKNAKQWTGPIAKNLTSAQIKYLRELPQMLVDADTSPMDIEEDNSYSIQNGKVPVSEKVYNVADIYMFYGYFGTEDKLQYVIRLDPKLFK